MTKKERILVVDDEPVIRVFVEKVAIRCGHEADFAPDALSAVEAMSKTDYSVVISDIKMPGKDGIWLLEEIKQRFPDTELSAPSVRTFKNQHAS